MGKNMKNFENYLESIYYKPEHPASYSSVDKLHRFVKSVGKRISKAEIKKWLSGQLAYNSHKEVRRTFKRRRVISPRKWYQFDVDTVSMIRFRKSNDGYNYILVLIDVMSKYAWTCPLKTLRGKEMVKALTLLIVKHPENLRSDGGSEFDNVDVKRFVKTRGINHFLTLNEKKANFAERLIKTLKSRITKYMHKHNSHEWVRVLPEITNSYNNTYHRSIRMSPVQAEKTNDVTLWNILYQSPAEKKTIIPKVGGPKRINPYKFKEGDKVKLSFLKVPFVKDYDSKWTDEYFLITGRNNEQNVVQYTIKDCHNNPIKGRFYEQELQRVEIPDGANTVYNIESILKRRTRNGKKEVFVHWEGWDKRYRSWIPASEVKDI
jgi:hypothetical protein